jgi:L-asparaginase II
VRTVERCRELASHRPTVGADCATARHHLLVAESPSVLRIPAGASARYNSRSLHVASRPRRTMTTSLHSAQKTTTAEATAYPDNPVLVRVHRSDAVESQHRGAWVLTDASGSVLDGVGSFERPIFTRSAVKCLQALPLLETGAAQHFGFSDAEVALCLASHNGEACHTEIVEKLLARLGLSAADLKCGAQPPVDPEARQLLRDKKQSPSALHNNCSGKHTGFLALALHLGVPVADYIDPESKGQRLVRKAVLEMTGLSSGELDVAVDGCSAPTFRMPLRNLAIAFARVANPSALPPLRRAACERMLGAVAAHPHLIAGHHQRICTDIARATGGRVFPKIGGEAVYAIGVRGGDRGLAIKIDDGATRGLHLLIVDLLRRCELASSDELAALAAWEEKRIRNWAGLEVGRTEVVA